MDPKYLAGLFDGEGCCSIGISFSKRTVKGRKYGPYWAPRLQVTIANNNRVYLKSIVSFLGFGAVYKVGPRKVHQIAITKPKQILTFVDIIIPHVVLKRLELELIRKSALFMLEVDSWTKENLDRFETEFVSPMKNLKGSSSNRGRPRRLFRNGNKA